GFGLPGAVIAECRVHRLHVRGRVGAWAQPHVVLLQVLGGGDAAERLRAAVKPGSVGRVEYFSDDPDGEPGGAGDDGGAVADSQPADVQERGIGVYFAWRAIPPAGDAGVVE